MVKSMNEMWCLKLVVATWKMKQKWCLEDKLLQAARSSFKFTTARFHMIDRTTEHMKPQQDIQEVVLPLSPR
jgi:hypothetical protein